MIAPHPVLTHTSLVASDTQQHNFLSVESSDSRGTFRPLCNQSANATQHSSRSAASLRGDNMAHTGPTTPIGTTTPTTRNLQASAMDAHFIGSHSGSSSIVRPLQQRYHQPHLNHLYPQVPTQEHHDPQRRSSQQFHGRLPHHAQMSIVTPCHPTTPSAAASHACITDICSPIHPREPSCTATPSPQFLPSDDSPHRCHRQSQY